MIYINDIWYNENSDEDLIEAAQTFNYDLAKALEDRFRKYQLMEHELISLKEW